MGWLGTGSNSGGAWQPSREPCEPLLGGWRTTLGPGSWEGGLSDCLSRNHAGTRAMVVEIHWVGQSPTCDGVCFVGPLVLSSSRPRVLSSSPSLVLSSCPLVLVSSLPRVFSSPSREHPWHDTATNQFSCFALNGRAVSAPALKNSLCPGVRLRLLKVVDNNPRDLSLSHLSLSPPPVNTCTCSTLQQAACIQMTSRLLG
jgi:hypothetical protein